jgi:Tol biopolymer transport system component
VVRRALGDRRTEPRFIATVQGRGYQLVAPVQDTNSDVGKRSVADGHTAPPANPVAGVAKLLERTGALRLGQPGVIAGVLAIGMVLAAVLALLTGYLPGHQSAIDVPIEYSVGRTAWLTRESMLELDPAYSPNGQFFAYAVGPIGQTDIFVQSVSGGDAINLTVDIAGAHGSPRWSPDGKHIAFRTVVSQSLDIIHIVPAIGGDSEPVVRAPFLTGHDWSPEGDRIVYTRADSLYLYSIADGASAQLRVSALEPHSPRWSPDGGTIAFVSDNSASVFGTDGFANIAPSAIWIVSADGSNERQVTDKAGVNTSPVWAGDSRSLLYLSDRDGARALYQVALPEADQGLPSPRFLTNLNAHTVSRSVDGDKLIYSELVISNNIWALPIPSGVPTPVAPALDLATPITHGNQMIEAIDVSSDGQWLLFDSNRSGNQDIYKLYLGQEAIGEPIRLTFDSAADFSPTWSPDDQEIAFHSLRTGDRDIWSMSADGLEKQPVTSDSTEERWPDWSPDGNKMAFVSDRASRWQVYTVSRRARGFDWSEPEQVTYDVGWFPRWSPNDELIAYTTEDAPVYTIALLTASSKDSTTCDLGELDGLYPVWAPDASRIYFKGTSAENVGIWSIKPDCSDITLLVSFKDLSSNGYPRTEFAVSDTHFYFTLRELASDIKTLELRDTSY